MLNVYVGWDSREEKSFDVACDSLRRQSSVPVEIRALKVMDLYEQRLLWRPVELRAGRMHDHLSDAPQSTDFATSRFLIPFIQRSGWALFVDCDVVAMADIAELFALADPRYAVMCVKHPALDVGGTKMDGQVQQAYRRKLWSSVMLINCEHRANVVMLDVKTVNSARGLWLHNFGWLCDDEIGALPAEWNWLVGIQEKPAEPKLAHYTLGTPDMCPGSPHAEIWHAAHAAIA